jgi:UDP-N-acetylglucosamine 2-epimerase (non-hydrolysing)
MKIILVAGARPNFMKIAPLIRAIHKHNELNKLGERLITPILVHTGQHYDYEMSHVFFQDLELPKPDVYLGVGSGTHAEQIGKVMIELEKVLLKENPDLVVVVGDVNSTLAAALAAVKLGIPVAHVEAGLRSYDRAMPEEINRLLTDQVSDYLFTHSKDADENLKKEGIPQEKIFFVGNIMIDSLLFNKARADQSQILAQLKLAEQGYALLTLHRPSNVDEKDSLTNIMSAITKISERIPVVFPVHPRTQKRLCEFNLNPQLQSKSQSNVLITPSLSYLDFLKLEMCAKFVMTDSGGIQEETTVLNVPCLTLRDKTERPITITRGTNVLVGSNPQKIVEEALRVLASDARSLSRIELWDGMAAERIIGILAKAV